MTENQKTPSKQKKPLDERVAAVLAEVRPLLQGDGGDLDLVGVDDQGVVRVQLTGACVGCPSAPMTLTLAIERHLKDRIPEVTRVECAE